MACDLLTLAMQSMFQNIEGSNKDSQNKIKTV